MTEIKPCPNRACHADCCVDADDAGFIWVRCGTCRYRTANYLHREIAIEEHNTLCADVALARNLRKILNEHQVVLRNHGDYFTARCFHGDEPIVAKAETLDAALALAARIGTSIGPDEGHDKVGGGDETL